MQDFPLKSILPLPIEGQTVLYADRDRWKLSSKQP
jgi:hypothetical protein